MKNKIFLILLVNLLVTTLAMASLEGVNIGDNVPVKKVKTIYGKILNLSDSKYEYVLVFYRGSWCPYCVNQLKSIESDILPNIKPKQKIVAISVDKNVVAKKMKSKFKLNYEIVSDPKAQLLRAFNIANKIDDELVKKYKNTYSIDIEEDSGEKHHIVAHPAVFIIKNGKIKYKDIHINYKERTKNEEIIKNLK